MTTPMLTGLRTEYRVNPLGLDAMHPRLSWRFESQGRGTLQSAYRVRVATSVENLLGESACVWDTGKVASAQSTQLSYAGAPLQSRQRYYWQVRIWDESGAVSPWSEAAWWEMGFLSQADWRAQWIAPSIDPDMMKSAPAPLLRSTFELSAKIARARVYVTSLGLYELHLNGQRVGDDLFTPGWTSFDKRLQYQVYDVSGLVKEGPNAIGAMLGDGWYRWEAFNRYQHRNNGKPFALLVQLEVTYEDGRAQSILSSADWKTATGPILMSELYNGEVYDARLERKGWTSAAFDDRGWACVQPTPAPGAALIAAMGPPVRRIEELRPVRIFETPAGTTVVDMGQNMVGWVRLRVRGTAGTTVTLRHAEILDPQGNFYIQNLRTAEQTIRYTLSGRGEEVFEPHFTFQGFRYVAVEGYPGEVEPGAITGVVLHSDMEQTGTLETSNPLLDRLQHNILWTLKGNYLEVPTDCPQRDERLGWGFDAQRFLPTAALNMDVAGFLTKWLGDLAADQTADGAVPMEAPRTHWRTLPVNELYASAGRKCDRTNTVEFIGAPGYGDAAIVVPWHLYLAYGDTRILESQYQSMTRWMQYVESSAGEDHIWDPDPNLGDWLDVVTTTEPTWFGSTEFDLMATAFYAHSADLLHRTATVLGKTTDAARYGELFENVRRAFQQRFVSAEGRVGQGKQTAHVLALDYDLLPESLRPLAARHLAEDIRARGHLTTGIGGTARLLNVLSRYGYDEEAYTLLTRREMPSWLYHVDHGATTIWERWDGIRVDGSLQNPAMNSFNHYALGAVGEWMYNVMGGIALDPQAPGYKHILIQPRPGGGMSHVKARHVTPYGEVSVAWRIDPGRFALSVTIPPNSTATVTFPAARVEEVLEGGHRLADTNGILAMRQAGPGAVIEIGSGKYDFSCRYGSA